MTKWIVDHFAEIQFGFLALVALAFFYRISIRSTGKSQFKKREHERPPKNAPWTAQKSLADRTDQSKTETTLQLEGFNPEQADHLILGIEKYASRPEIEKAFREQMKRYHPDRMARVDTEQWHEAHKIAQRILEAKQNLLKRTQL